MLRGPGILEPAILDNQLFRVVFEKACELIGFCYGEYRFDVIRGHGPSPWPKKLRNVRVWARAAGFDSYIYIYICHKLLHIIKLSSLLIEKCWMSRRSQHFLLAGVFNHKRNHNKNASVCNLDDAFPSGFQFDSIGRFALQSDPICQPFSGPKTHLRNWLESLRKGWWNEETESLHENPDFLYSARGASRQHRVFKMTGLMRYQS